MARATLGGNDCPCQEERGEGPCWCNDCPCQEERGEGPCWCY